MMILVKMVMWQIPDVSDLLSLESTRIQIVTLSTTSVQSSGGERCES